MFPDTPLLNISHFLLPAEFNRIHPFKTTLLPADIVRARRLKYLLRNWRKLLTNPLILVIVQGYTIPFTSQPKTGKPPRPIVMSKEETKLVDQEIQEMLSKGAIKITEKMENQFLSSLFLVG